MNYIQSLAVSESETTFEQFLNRNAFKGDSKRDFEYKASRENLPVLELAGKGKNISAESKKESGETRVKDETLTK